MLKSIKSFEDFLQLENSFKGVKFYEKDHKYKINNELCKCSVTTLLKKYGEEFDSEKTAKIVSLKQNRPVDDILKEWNFKREYACFKGTDFHKYVENFLNRKFSPLDLKGFHYMLFQEGQELDAEKRKEEYRETMKFMVKNFLNFYKWYDELYHCIKSEFVVGDFDSKICGTIDNLSYNKKTKNLSIFDYKTNQSIKTEGFKGKTLLDGLSHLQDCEFSKYSLQLHIYKRIIEKNSNFKIDDLYIVWFPENKEYQLIKPLDLEKEAEYVLNKEVIIS
jgi:ATP-dependent exoDNAse (exonuclease V) beta subunit